MRPIPLLRIQQAQPYGTSAWGYNRQGKNCLLGDKYDSASWVCFFADDLPNGLPSTVVVSYVGSRAGTQSYFRVTTRSSYMHARFVEP
jgi:hypothetical protein